MKSFAFFFIILMPAFAISQIIEDPLRSMEKAKFDKYKENKIKTMTVTVKGIDEKGKPIEDSMKIVIVSFDHKKNRIEKLISLKGDSVYKLYYFNGHGDPLKIIKDSKEVKKREVYKYTYDDKGRMLKRFKYTGNQALQSYEEFKYKGNELKTSIYNEKGILTGKIMTTYDDFNRIYSSKMFSSDKKLIKQNRYFLNAEDQLVKHEFIDHLNNIKKKMIFEYDENKNIRSELTADFEGKPQEKKLYIYYENGMPERIIKYKPVDKKTQVSVFKYKYIKED